MHLHAAGVHTHMHAGRSPVASHLAMNQPLISIGPFMLAHHALSHCRTVAPVAVAEIALVQLLAAGVPGPGLRRLVPRDPAIPWSHASPQTANVTDVATGAARVRRRAMERLIRKLLSYRNAPAVSPWGVLESLLFLMMSCW